MKRSLMLALVALITVISSGCNGGPRPTLIQPPGATPAPPLTLDLPPAPSTVAPLLASPEDLTLESSVDDALLAWALNRKVPYLDSCAVTTPAAGQFCDSPTERDTVRLLGPSTDEIWYVVTVDEVSSFDLGAGFRVADVQIAGR